MDYQKQKKILKMYRDELLSSDSDLHVEFASEVIETLNTMIGRINCYMTNDDLELERLAVVDGLRVKHDTV